MLHLALKTGDDPSASDRNLVHFGRVALEFTRLDCVIFEPKKLNNLTDFVHIRQTVAEARAY